MRGTTISEPAPTSGSNTSPRFHWCFLFFFLAACDAPPLIPIIDAGTGSRTLVILDPPGESIGIPFGGAAALRVRLYDEIGAPAPFERVTFAIAADSAQGEAPAGAT